jgi:CPA2 family monovalent cation:H+ antiporter-2
MLIGPYTFFFPTVTDIPTINDIADLGIIILLFALGLHFNLNKLRKVGSVAIFAGSATIVCMVTIGYMLGLAFGWSETMAFFLGTMMAISSTAFIMMGLNYRGVMEHKSSQIAMAILIIEDIAAVLILTIISGIALTGSINPGQILVALVTVVAFILFFLSFGFLILPGLIRWISATGSSGMLLIASLGLCFGFSIMGAALGVSVAIGAFLTGAVIGGCKEAPLVEREVRPIKEIFTAVFFVSVGMLFDPMSLINYWFPVAIIAIVFVIAKGSLSTTGTFLFGQSGHNALKIGLTMTVMGEFSYIIAYEGLKAGIMPESLYQIIISASLITIVVNVVLTSKTRVILRGISSRTPLSIKRYLAFFTLSINTFKARSRGSKRLSVRARVHLQEIAASTVFILFILVTLRFAMVFSHSILNILGLDPGHLFPFRLIISLAALVLVLTSLLMILKSSWRFLDKVSLPTYATFSSGHIRQDTVGFHTFKLLVLANILLVGTVVVVLVLTGFLGFGPIFLVVIGSMLLVMTFLFYQSVHRFNSRMTQLLLKGIHRSQAQEFEGDAPRASEPPDLPVERLLLEGDTIRYLRLRKDSPNINKALKETDFRKKYGVSIIGIVRNRSLVVNPTPDDILLEGDKLLLLGSREVPMGR